MSKTPIASPPSPNQQMLPRIMIAAANSNSLIARPQLLPTKTSFHPLNPRKANNPPQF